VHDIRISNHTESKTGNQSLLLTSACLTEDSRAEESDDIDTAQLLRNHDHERRQCCAANTRDGEELDELTEIVALSHDIGFNLELGMDVVQVASGLNVVESEAFQGLESLEIFVLLDIPSGRFR
jgi:hypothetical protein